MNPSGPGPAARPGPARRSGARALTGAIVGLVSAGVTLGVGEFIAAFVRPAASPVIAVGNRFVLLTPEWLKREAIREFGTGDKSALLTGIYVIVALFAVVIGVLAMRRLAFGIGGVLLLGVVGCYAALTAKASHGSDVVPTIIGTAAGLATMVALVRTAIVAEAAESAESARGSAPAADAGPFGGWARRRFLLSGAAAAGLAAVTGFGGRAAQHSRFDVAAARAKVQLPPPTDPAPALPAGVDVARGGQPWATPTADFYRIDTALTVPQIDPATWSLRIHGMVDREVTIDYAQLIARPLIERWVTLCCVSNEVGGDLIGNARFLGARLPDLLREAGLNPEADQLLMRSSDGMTIGAPIAAVMDGRDAMIAIGMNGVPLPVEHGFPARIVVPGLYGYVSACKWVVDIQATMFQDTAAYWVQGGWQARPDIKLASRIDTPRGGTTVTVGQPVAVAGVAWDQHVGVSKVEFQVNNGEWTTARLAPVPSIDTWRQWVGTWTPPAAGAYTLRVRATDASGQVQTQQVTDPFPGGATGWHALSLRARA